MDKQGKIDQGNFQPRWVVFCLLSCVESISVVAFFVLDGVCVGRSVRSCPCEKGRNCLFVGRVMRREV